MTNDRPAWLFLRPHGQNWWPGRDAAENGTTGARTHSQVMMSSSAVCWVKNDERRPSRTDKPVYLFLFYLFFRWLSIENANGDFSGSFQRTLFTVQMMASAVEGILAPLTPQNRFLQLIPSSVTPADYRPIMASRCFRPPGQVASPRIPTHQMAHTHARTHTH